MTVSQVAHTGTSTTATPYGSTSTTVAYPASSVAAGRMAIIVAASKMSTTTWNTVTGYTLVTEGTGGTGTTSTTTGTSRIGVWYRILDGSESGSVTVSTSGGDANSAVTAAMSVYSRNNSQWEVPFAVTASDTTDGTNPSAVAGTWPKPLIPLDYLIVGYASEQSTTTVPSAQTVTQTSATFGTRTHRNYRNNTSGDDNTLTTWDGTVTTGNTNAPTLALTWTVSTAGAFAAVALRDSSAGWSNNFEGGTDTTTISTGNSGGTSGQAFDFVSIPATAAITFSTTAAATGTLGALISAGGTAGTPHVEAAFGWNTASDSPIYGRLRYRVPSLPASAIRIAVIAGGDGSFQGDWRLNTDGTIGMYTGTGTLIGTTTAAVTANQWFDIGVAITSFNATTGSLEAKLFLDPNSNTATETITGTNRDTLRNGGRNTLQMGIMTSVASTTIHLDNIQWGRTDYPSAIPMFSIVTGSAALSSESSLDSSGTVETFASSALSGQSSVTVAASANTFGSAVLSGQSTFTVSGIATSAGVTAFSSQGSLTVSGTVSKLGSVALSAQSNLSVTATTSTTPPSAVLSGQSNLAVTGTIPVTLRNTLEGGTNGVAITTGNSGGASGTAFTVVTVAGTSTVVYDNAHVKHGAMALKVTAGGTSENAFAGLALSSASTSGTAQCYMYLTAYPTTQTRIMQFTTAAGAGRDSVAITSAGKLRWDSFSGTDVSMSTSVPLNTWFRVAMVGDVNSSSVHLFTDVESSTATESLTGLAPLSGDIISYVRFGWTSSNAGFTAWFDTVETNNSATIPNPFASVLTGSSVLTAQSGLIVTPLVTTGGVLTLSAQSSLSSIGTRMVLGTCAMSVESGLVAAANAMPPWVLPFIELNQTTVSVFEGKSSVSGEYESRTTIVTWEGG